eukprot:m.40070 g.40070  ORF g.40070 m.40070 type:complete len:54 (-) comp10392_c1_seq1:31-192(-)
MEGCVCFMQTQAWLAKTGESKCAVVTLLTLLVKTCVNTSQHKLVYNVHMHTSQ